MKKREVDHVDWQHKKLFYKNLNEQDPDGYFVTKPPDDTVIIHDVLDDVIWFMREMMERSRVPVDALPDNWTDNVRMTYGEITYRKEIIPTHTAYLCINHNYHHDGIVTGEPYWGVDLTDKIMAIPGAKERAARIFTYKKIIRVWLDVRERKFTSNKLRMDSVMARLQAKPEQVHTVSYRVSLGPVDLVHQY